MNIDVFASLRNAQNKVDSSGEGTELQESKLRINVDELTRDRK